MVSGEINEYFKNLTVAAGSIESGKFEGLGKWNLNQLEPLSSHYMKDYSCETFSKRVGKAFSECEKNITGAAILEKQMRYMVGGDKQEITGTSLRYTTIGFKHVLLPVWSFNVMHNNKEYHLYMNGQSGRLSAKLPAARYKLMLITGGICVALAGLGYIVFQFL